MPDPTDKPSPSAAEPFRTCSACAHRNPAGQRFCGMCGAPLQDTPVADFGQAVDAASVSTTHGSEPESSPGGNFREYAIEPAVSSAAPSGGNDALEPAWTAPERSLPSFDLAAESEPVRYRYRLYLGAALAILIAFLVFRASRGTKAISGAAGAQPAVSGTIPAAPPAATAASAQPSPTGNAESGDNPTVSPPRSENEPPATSRKNQTDSAPRAAPVVTTTAGSSAIAAESGAQDLATAQRYLNGTQGTARDSREGVYWLWRAVGKGNLAATVALSDLYLRGDGVPKSCDQARLLLDAAAKKGGAAAAARLRNLQAFGCE